MALFRFQASRRGIKVRRIANQTAFVADLALRMVDLNQLRTLVCEA